MVRHGWRRADRGWCLQVRLATSTTSEDYITGKLWQYATLSACPWHPEGGCGFAGHGTYERVNPPNTFVARWYCPTAKRTVSALPDCLTSHGSGTFDECELIVCLVENASSLSAACHDLRPEVQLPGILRFVTRLVRQITHALRAIKGLMPLRFTCQPRLCEVAALLDTSQVLMTLRGIACQNCQRHWALIRTAMPCTTIKRHSNTVRGVTRRWLSLSVARDPYSSG